MCVSLKPRFQKGKDTVRGHCYTEYSTTTTFPTTFSTAGPKIRSALFPPRQKRKRARGRRPQDFRLACPFARRCTLPQRTAAVRHSAPREEERRFPLPVLHSTPRTFSLLGSRTSSSGAAAVSDRRQLEMAVPPRTFLYGSPPRPGRWRSIVGPRSPRSDQSGAARQRHGLSGQGHVAGYRRAKLGARSGAPVIAAGAAGQGMRQAGRPAAAGGERGVATGQAASVRMHAPPMFRCWIFPVRSLARREIR
jgi:hypothetical protein